MTSGSLKCRFDYWFNICLSQYGYKPYDQNWIIFIPVCLSWLKILDLAAAVVAELAVGLPNQYFEDK